MFYTAKRKESLIFVTLRIIWHRILLDVLRDRAKNSPVPELASLST